MILSKDLSGLKSYFHNNPEFLLENADLIKLHLELGTLNLEELLPILGGAAERMMEQDRDEFVGGDGLKAKPYPSLFSVFSNEILPVT